jgi:hypothetical protein
LCLTSVFSLLYGNRVKRPTSLSCTYCLVFKVQMLEVNLFSAISSTSRQPQLLYFITFRLPCQA